VVTSEDDGTLTLSAPTSNALVEAAEATPRDRRHHPLCGLFGFAGLTAARGTVIQLGAGWRAAVALALLAAICLAAWVIYWAYRAAYGWPKARSVHDDDGVLAWYAEQVAIPARSAVMLRAGVPSADASLAALVVLIGMLWLAPPRSSGALYRFRTRRSGCDLQFGRMSRMGQDRGLCLFASSI